MPENNGENKSLKKQAEVKHLMYTADQQVGALFAEAHGYTAGGMCTSHFGYLFNGSIKDREDRKGGAGRFSHFRAMILELVDETANASRIDELREQYSAAVSEWPYEEKVSTGEQALAVLNRVSRAAEQLNTEADRVNTPDAKKTDALIITDVLSILPPRWKTGTGTARWRISRKSRRSSSSCSRS